MSLDINAMNGMVVIPGAPTRGFTNFIAPSFEINGPNSKDGCPIQCSGVVFTGDSTLLSSPVIYTPYTSNSTITIAALSSVEIQSPSMRFTNGGGNLVGNLVVSSINGAAPGGGSSGPNLVVSTLVAYDSVTTSTINVSSINGAAPGGAIPTFEYSQGLRDGYLSSFAVTANEGAAAAPFRAGIPLTPYISTQQGHIYQTSGCFEISSLGNLTATSPNAFLYIWGGGGPGGSWNNQGVFPYPMVSTAVAVNGGVGQFQWNAPGGFNNFNIPSNGLYPSTMRYILCASPDWAVPVGVNVSSLIGRVAYTDLANITTTDFGQFTILP